MKMQRQVTKSQSALKANLANFCLDETILLFDKIARMRAIYSKLEGIKPAWKFRKFTDNALWGVLKQLWTQPGYISYLNPCEFPLEGLENADAVHIVL